VSISPTFYEQLFLYASVLPNFYVPTIVVCTFWQKKIGKINARRMLAELTIGLKACERHAASHLSLIKYTKTEQANNKRERETEIVALL